MEAKKMEKTNEERKQETDKQSAAIAATILTSATFRFQTLEEAQALATFLGNACPNACLVIMGLTEVLLNAVEHGNLGITSDEKTKLNSENTWHEEIAKRLKSPQYKDKYVEVEFKRTDTEIRIKVTDKGDGFDWRIFENINSEHKKDSHGRGIAMAKNLAFKKLEYSDKGNEVTCVIPLITE